jgi:hypothetical protein
VTTERATFGARLRREREARTLSISDVVKITKIPERSLIALENGAFEELPAEVFVRGFLRSYCKSVGLDVEEILASYQELIGAGSPKLRDPPSLTKLPPPREEAAAPPPAATAPTGLDGQTAPVEGAPAEPVEAKEKEEPSVFSLLAGAAGRSTGRASLTVAVIILVIVATLTLSLLLRRPSHVGDGVSSIAVETQRVII